MPGNLGCAREPSGDQPVEPELRCKWRPLERARYVPVTGGRKRVRSTKIVRWAVDRRLPYGLTASSFSELPILWEEQLQIAS